VDQLLREVDRRRSVLVDLLDQRQQLENEMAALEGQISELRTLTAGNGGPRRGRRGRIAAFRKGPAFGKWRRQRRGAGRRAGTRRGRGSNENSLVSSLHTLLRGKTMGVADMSQAVRRAGYKTSSPNFRTIVNAALITNPDKFKRVARGQYTSK
jgi:hypothetical protein